MCATVSSACLSTCLVQPCLPKQLWLAGPLAQRVYTVRCTGSVCMRRWAAALQIRIASSQIRRNRQIQILSSESHPAESDRCGSVLIFGAPVFPSRRPRGGAEVFFSGWGDSWAVEANSVQNGTPLFQARPLEEDPQACTFKASGERSASDPPGR